LNHWIGSFALFLHVIDGPDVPIILSDILELVLLPVRACGNALTSFQRLSSLFGCVTADIDEVRTTLLMPVLFLYQFLSTDNRYMRV